MSTGTEAPHHQCQINGHDLINTFAKQGTITSPTVMKAEYIPTDLYLDIYVTV